MLRCTRCPVSWAERGRGQKLVYVNKIEWALERRARGGAAGTRLVRGHRRHVVLDFENDSDVPTIDSRAISNRVRRHGEIGRTTTRSGAEQ